MDNTTLKQLSGKNPFLAKSFAGTWSADNFPKQKTSRLSSSIRSTRTTQQLVWFQIINTSPAHALGKHWLLLGAVSKEDTNELQIFAWDCLGQPLSVYKIFFERLKELYGKCGYREIFMPLQNPNSNMCGLYCLFLINYIAKKPYQVPHLDTKLKQCTEIDIIRFINYKYKTVFRYRVK